ncbi:MAG: 2-phosphosulfolactate phosphatase [Nocardioides sp.]
MTGSVTVGAHGQAAYARRLDWGLAGARALVADARPGDVAVVVDVLSFTTTLTVAVEQGVAVHPYPWRSEQAAAYAAERAAILAVGRREGLATQAVSLSPASFLAASDVDRVVLPSPNGSTIAFALADAGVTVVGASLRNAAAVAAWLRDRRASTVSVVAAGERWPDGQLRPAVEDLWGAGAVLAALGGTGVSPEAEAAEAAFRAVEQQLSGALPQCASGRELVEAGFAADVDLAAAHDVSEVVPVLYGDAFVDGSS